jgi:hypothetical protein
MTPPTACTSGASPQLPFTETSPGLAAASWFYEVAMPLIDVDRWLRALGVDMATALALAGPICVCPIISFGSTFQLAENDECGAMSAVVHVVTGADAETPIGLVAWRGRPERVLACHAVGLPALGIDQLDNRATYLLGRPCLVHRTPPLDCTALWWALNELPERPDGYPLAAETQHTATSLWPSSIRSRLVSGS